MSCMTGQEVWARGPASIPWNYRYTYRVANLLHVMGRRLLLNRVPIRLARLLGVGLQYLDASAGSTRTMGGLARRGAPPARVLSIRRVVFLGDLNGR